MKKWSLKEYNIKLLIFTICISLFTTIINLPIPIEINIILNNIWFIILFIVDICILLQRKENRIFVYRRLKSNKLFFCVLSSYYIIEIITFFRSNNYEYCYMRIANMSKLFIIIMTVVICNTKKENLKNLLACVGITNILILVISIVLYYNDYNYYLEKISTIRDYNVFSEYIFFGMVCATTYIVKYIDKAIIKTILLSILFALNFSVILYSGSRRGIIYVIVFIIGLVFYGIYSVVFYKNFFKKAVMSIFIMIVCVSGVYIQNINFNNHIENYYNIENKINTSQIDQIEENKNGIEENRNDEFSRGQGETSNKSRYKTITLKENQALASREKIWEIAIGKINEEPLMKLILGNGLSYSKEIYEDLNNPNVVALMNKTGTDKSAKEWMTPHNIVLSTVLEGGLLKVAILIILHCVIVYSILKTKDSKYILCSGLLLIEFIGIFILGCDNGVLSDELWISFVTIVLMMNYKKVNNYEIKDKSE